MPAAHSVTTYLLTRDVAASTEFYGALCGYLPVHRGGWFTLIAPSADVGMQIGLVDWVSEFVPRAARGDAQAHYLEVVVDDVHAALAAVESYGVEIIEYPIEHGAQARAVLRDLDGRVITVVTPTSRFLEPPRQHAG